MIFGSLASIKIIDVYIEKKNKFPLASINKEDQMNLNKKRRGENEKFLSQDLDTLLSTLSLIESSKVEGLKYLPGQEIEQGTQIFESIRDFLYQKVCVEWQFYKKRNDPDLNDTVNLTATMIDTISTPTLRFPPVLIASILVKEGLSKFCGCNTKKS